MPMFALSTPPHFYLWHLKCRSARSYIEGKLKKGQLGNELRRELVVMIRFRSLRWVQFLPVRKSGRSFRSRSVML